MPEYPFGQLVDPSHGVPLILQTVRECPVVPPDIERQIADHAGLYNFKHKPSWLQ